MAELKLAAPWTTYYREIKALFEKDPEVQVLFVEGAKPEVKIYVDNTAKADAMLKMLPEKKVFGNISIDITVIPGNQGSNPSSPVEDLFSGNDAVASIQKVRILGGFMTFVLFKKEVVQFFNDDISDIHGLCSTLYENIAQDVLVNVEGIFFCTDIGTAALGMPLGEWP